MSVIFSKHTVLVVDDHAENIDILVGILQSDYKIKAAINGNQALDIAVSAEPPDLILLDIQMQGMDGFEVCRKLKETTIAKNIPVIFLTSMNETADEAKGFSLGAVDYIAKPVVPQIVLARVKTHLALSDQNRELEKKVAERTVELQNVQDVTIFSLSVLAEFRDNETGAHILRTREYVRFLAQKLLDHPKYRKYMDIETVNLMQKSAPLHDIGKVGIPDNILFKPAKLTVEEFEIIKNHTVYGRDVIAKAEETLKAPQDLSFLRFARDITISHHERWDGKGYPAGLAGENIPLVGRIMALADVYDALISKRVYKPAMSHEEVRTIMANETGHFDPDLFGVFWENSDDLHKIALRKQDTNN